MTRMPLVPPVDALPPVGIGWRHPHYRALLEALPEVDFLEVHSENFFADGGAAEAVLREARAHYAVSLHGVGLGLGSAAGLDPWHLDRLARLADAIAPVRVSDHACFARGSVDGVPVHASDLLPLPFNEAALACLSANVQRAQERLRRPLLVENLSAYLALAGSDLHEADFLAALVRRTGCRLLLDVNNLYVNALNARHRGDATDPEAACRDWMARLPRDAVGEIHVAGHCVLDDIVIDDHGSRVAPAVWRLYADALRRFGAVPTLVEWDTDLPPLSVLLDEAAQARRVARAALAPAVLEAAS